MSMSAHVHTEEKKISDTATIDRSVTKQSIEQSVDIVSEPFQPLVHHVVQNGDIDTASKLVESIQKWERGVLHIGFCGLFSAGKSTMINFLLGKDLLPSSPIPTSANIVSIGYGPSRAIITFTNSEQVDIDVSELERWKAYCKNGEDVRRIDIYDPNPLLKNNLHLLDTPGIDSTDEQHQRATEDALHLADVVMFVADYHHVQSEQNFSFLKQLKDKGKIVFLIINQVDKHIDTELSLPSFQERLKSGLDEWGVKVDGLWCTSFKQPKHPYNQASEVIALFEQLETYKQDILNHHLRHALNHVIEAQRPYLIERQTNGRDNIDLQLNKIKAEINYEDESTFALHDTYMQAHAHQQHWKEQLEGETEYILKNAIITPYTTTQLAQQLIDSYQDDFKVGWLFAKKKTDEERNRRAQELYDDMSERVTSQIEWHLKDSIQKTATEVGLNDQEVLKQLTDWHLELPKEWLTSQIKTGVVSREYVYTYTKTLQQKINQLYRRHMDQLMSIGLRFLVNVFEQQFAGKEHLLKAFEQIEKLNQELAQLDHEVDQSIQNGQQMIDSIYNSNLMLTNHSDRSGYSMVDKIDWEQKTKAYAPKGDEGLNDIIGQMTDETEKQTSDTKMSDTQGTNVTDPNVTVKNITDTTITRKNNTEKKVNATKSSDSQDNRTQANRTDGRELKTDDLDEMVNKYDQALQVLEQVPSLNGFVEDLAERKQRLEGQRFRICLFGAFSAGKSSFANALLGANVLPVSPHPTTAAIIHIVPPTATYQSGEALIRLKSFEQVEKEVHICIDRLQLKRQSTMKETLKQVVRIKPQELRSTLKAYYSFLKACSQGWEAIEEQLGQQLIVHHDDYIQYASNESTACFVQSIDYHYDSPLTQLGFELIDTPGADSIYARHTDVTFNFIKHADVLVYLTYFNHAFSRADKQFLDQLGRVKEQFSMDKMFFIVNAADLASSEQEQQDVLQHVENNLLTSNIRFPRLYPVSSLRVLQGKHDPGMSQFQDAFYSFIENDLFSLQLQSASTDINKGYHLLVQLRNELEHTLQSKDEKIAHLTKQKQHWIQQIQTEQYPSLSNELSKEVSELLYYVKQRFFFNFKEHLDEAFHPTYLSGKQATKEQLRRCLDELLFALVQQLNDEFKATSLRLENVLLRFRDRVVDRWVRTAEEEKLTLTGQLLEEMSLNIPEGPKQLGDNYNSDFEKCLKHFKNPKQFFEQDGKSRLREAFEDVLKLAVDDYVREAEETLEQFYSEAWGSVSSAMKNALQEELEMAVNARIAVLEGECSLEDLSSWIESYKQIVSA